MDENGNAYGLTGHPGAECMGIFVFLYSFSFLLTTTTKKNTIILYKSQEFQGGGHSALPSSPVPC